MNFTLDMTTVLFLIVLGHLFTIILISAYRSRFANDAATRLFSMSKWLQAASWCICIFRGSAPFFIGVFLPNCLLFIATALEILALLKVIQDEEEKLQKFLSYLCAGSIAGFLLICLFWNTESVRIFYASLMVAAFVFFPVYLLFKDRQNASPLRQTIGIMYGLLFLGLLLRTFLALPFTSQMSLFSSPNLFQTVSYISLYFMMLVGNIGFILMSKEYSDGLLLRFASYDDLTGLMNRRTFIERSEMCIDALSENGEPVSFMLFDIDRYKQINDTYGHYVGDLVLKDMASCIRKEVNARGLIGRYGGDEFAVLLPGIGEQESDLLADELREYVSLNGSSLSHIDYTISMGVVTLPAGLGVDMSMLYRLCDEALYEAKRLGRNRVERTRITDETDDLRFG